MLAQKLLQTTIRRLTLWIAVFSVILLCQLPHAHAKEMPSAPSETLGDLAVSGLFIEPSFLFTEPHRGQFQVGQSFLALTWTRDRLLSATIKLGSRSLIGKPARYGAAATDDIAVIESFAQLDSGYGRLRAGIIPIPFGLEGGDSEGRLSFPRSQLYNAFRVINIRDYGVSYHITNVGFFSDWAAHNGEGGPDLDNEMWFTLRGGWQGGRFVRLGFSGSTGSTNPTSTNPTGSTWTSSQAGLDVTQRSKIRIANTFLNWEVDPFEFSIEATGGDTAQDSGNRKFRALHVDTAWNTNSETKWLARYDSFDPTLGPGDRVDEWTLGLAWSTKYQNSVVYLLATKQVLEDNPIGVHKFQLIWRMTPMANSFRTSL